MQVLPEQEEQVQLELPMGVLCRLLRERNLVACEFRGLNGHSKHASWRAIKQSVVVAQVVVPKKVVPQKVVPKENE